jgi:hypothetical protein
MSMNKNINWWPTIIRLFIFALISMFVMFKTVSCIGQSIGTTIPVLKIDSFFIENDSLTLETSAGTFKVTLADYINHSLYTGSGSVPDLTNANILRTITASLGYFPGFPLFNGSADYGLIFKDSIGIINTDSVTGYKQRVMVYKDSVVIKMQDGANTTRVIVTPTISQLTYNDNTYSTHIKALQGATSIYSTDGVDASSIVTSPTFVQADANKVILNDLSGTGQGTAGYVWTSKGLNNGGQYVTVGSILDSIATNQIKTQAVTTAKLADLSVTNGKIAGAAVTSGKIAVGAVGTTELADSAATAAKIGTNAVTTVKINDTAVTAIKIKTNAITTVKINDTAVTSIKIKTDAITTAKIVDTAVTTVKLKTQGVTTAKLADNAVTGVKITNATITANKLENSGVTSGSYTLSDLTVNDQGLITAISNGSGGASYLVYTGIVQLIGNVVLAGTVFQNTLGCSPSWSHTSSGVYTFDTGGSSCFTTSKTFISFSPFPNAIAGIADTYLYGVETNSAQSINLKSYTAPDVLGDGNGDIWIEIRVYP